MHQCVRFKQARILFLGENMKSVKLLFISLMFAAQNGISSDFSELYNTEGLKPISLEQIRYVVEYLPHPMYLVGTGFLIWHSATHRDRGIVYTAGGLTALGLIKLLSTPGSATALLTATPGEAIETMQNNILDGTLSVTSNVSSICEFFSRQSLLGMIVTGTGLTIAGALFTAEAGNDPTGGGGIVLGGAKLFFIPAALGVAGLGILIMRAEQSKIIY